MPAHLCGIDPSTWSGDQVMSQRLGDLLVKEKIITPEQLEQANKAQKEQSCRLGSALVKLGFLTDEAVTNFLSRQYGEPTIHLSYFEIDPAVVKLIPFETAKRYQIFPLSRVGASLTIAMVDPTNVFAMDDIKFMTGFNIEPVVASESSINEGIEKAYGTSNQEELETVMQSMTDLDADVELQTEEQEMELADLERAADEAPIVKLVNLVLTDAVKRGASDIHMEPYEKEFRVRFRIDGVLQSIMSPPLKLKDAITSRVKQPDTNIMTAEDPVEFQLQGVNQVQMKEQIGLNFAAALRAFLRQDPNIILVGEIRDFETAEIAIKAALTGHLVLSTLHTNGAPETITRLMNMGIEPFLVATSVHLICAQRLVRRICRDCAETIDMPQQALIEEGYSPEEAKTVKIQKGKGCGTCNNTGYKGRTGLYEVMEVDDEIRELVLVGASALELKKKAIERGMLTLRRSGLIKVAAGWTTLEEVARETIH